MVRDLGRTTQASLSSQEFALLLDTYVLFWMGRTLSLLLAFTSREQSNVRFDLQMTRELTAVFQGSVKVGTFPDVLDCAGVHRHKNPS